MRYCNTCGRSEADHDVRHPFVAAKAANWHHRFIELARHFAGWSKDPSTQVGAVIVDEKRRIVGEGYNGFPRGVKDTKERLAHRPTKYSLVVHAEANAILSATRVDLEGCTLYVTHRPCTECAKLVIQSGIRTIFVPHRDGLEDRWSDDQDAADQMLSEAGVYTYFQD